MTAEIVYFVEVQISDAVWSLIHSGSDKDDAQEIMVQRAVELPAGGQIRLVQRESYTTVLEALSA